MRLISDQINRMFSGVQARQRSKHASELDFTFTEFVLWLGTQSFEELFSNYLLSGESKDLVPSVDRIDDRYGYSFDNMQLLTWSDNRCKRREQEKLAIVTQNGIWNRLVHQYTIDGIYIATYKTCRIAANTVDGNKDAISACAGGNRRHSAGYQWSYKFTESRPALKVLSKRPNKVFWYSDESVLLGEFDTYKEASLASGVTSSRIGEIVAGKRKQSKGYTFSKKE